MRMWLYYLYVNMFRTQPEYKPYSIYSIDIYTSVCIYPPTPALAKAGAAPGTTADVELLLLSFPRKHCPGMLHPAVKTSRHLDMKITCFGQVSFPPEGFVWRFCLSRLLLRFPRSNPSRSQPGMNRHPKATHQWLLMGRLNNPLACFILQPTGTPRPHINGFLWASKPAVCQPLNP